MYIHSYNMAVRNKTSHSVKYNVAGKELEFHTINSTISIFSYTKKFHITPEHTTGLIHLLLQRATEELYSNISIKGHGYVGNNSNNDFVEGYPINSILIEIVDKKLWFNMVSTQTVSFDGKFIFFDYPDLLFIDRFAIDNESDDYREDVRIISSVLNDLCNRPSSLNIVFHVLYDQVFNLIKQMTNEYGNTFWNKYMILENDINVNILYRHLDILQNYTSKKIKLQKEFYQFLGRAQRRMRERKY